MTPEQVNNSYLYIQDNRVNNLSPNWGIMLTMQENLNMRIGVKRRKKYISAAFWNYISTPINFIITLFTALSASQTGTSSNFLTTDQVFYILLFTFILSIVNTFFKLKEKAQMNYESAKVYEGFGSDFEDIYFTPILVANDVDSKLKKYTDLHKKLTEYSNSEKIDGVNYITEFIFYWWAKKYNQRLRQIERNERYWVLDGRPHHDYENDYKIEVEDFFISDFDKAEKPKDGGIIHGFIGMFGGTKNEPHPAPTVAAAEDDVSSDSVSSKHKRDMLTKTKSQGKIDISMTEPPSPMQV
jgi:hypothetical protein